jgi:hypothetical protein
MGNRATESKKRSERARRAARHCRDCYWGDTDPPGGSVAVLCGRHACSAITKRGTRCRNSATYPEQRACGIHIEAPP